MKEEIIDPEPEKKGFFKKWKEGIMNITPSQQLKAKCTGTIGAILGLILAMIVMLYRGIWYFGLFLLALIFLQFIQYIGTKQQLKAALGVEEQIKAAQQDLNSARIDTMLGNNK